MWSEPPKKLPLSKLVKIKVSRDGRNFPWNFVSDRERVKITRSRFCGKCKIFFYTSQR